MSKVGPDVTTPDSQDGSIEWDERNHEQQDAGHEVEAAQLFV
jgi:hypothetical protein